MNGFNNKGDRHGYWVSRYGINNEIVAKGYYIDGKLNGFWEFNSESDSSTTTTYGSWFYYGGNFIDGIRTGYWETKYKDRFIKEFIL